MKWKYQIREIHFLIQRNALKTKIVSKEDINNDCEAWRLARKHRATFSTNQKPNQKQQLLHTRFDKTACNLLRF